MYSDTLVKMDVLCHSRIGDIERNCRVVHDANERNCRAVYGANEQNCRVVYGANYGRVVHGANRTNGRVVYGGNERKLSCGVWCQRTETLHGVWYQQPETCYDVACQRDRKEAWRMVPANGSVACCCGRGQECVVC